MTTSTMARDAIVVRFSREGERTGIPLSTSQTYQVTVDDGPWEPFHVPWEQDELDDLIDILRNTDPENRPEIDQLNVIGRSLGEALSKVPSLAAQLIRQDRERLVVFWQLDYPELARIPWELASSWTPPHHHLLLEPDITFARTVPLYHPRAPTGWPIGARSRPRLLYVWGEKPGGEVPHRDHLETLQKCCEERDADLVAQEITTAAQLTQLTAADQFDFVHILAHGTKTRSGEWGLRLGEEDATGEQIGRALVAGEQSPSMVTLAACDSAGEESDSFGSVAYQLHAHGVPMVVGSQFRLRKRVSTVAAAEIYEALLGGHHPMQVLSNVRRQLSPESTEAWSNDVLYMNYPLEVLDEGAYLGRRRAALRRARRIVRAKGEQDASIAALEAEVESLQELVGVGIDPAETYGLLGGIVRRIAYLRGDEADEEDLRDARDYFVRGLRADLNSTYCGINAVHLSLMLGDQKMTDLLLPIVRFASQSQLDDGASAYWACASAGEVAVYEGDAESAVEYYREFVRRERQVVTDVRIQTDQLLASRNQMSRFQAAIDLRDTNDVVDSVRHAAAEVLKVLDSALSRIGYEP